MITANNYAAQAQRGMEVAADVLDARGDRYKVDALLVRKFAESIGQAQHFALPDDGVIFDDNLRGLSGQCLRLPYQSITVEYFAPKRDDYRDEAPIYSPKRLLLAQEVTRELLSRYEQDGFCGIASVFNGLDNTDILIAVFVACEIYGMWTPCPLVAMIPSEWQGYNADPSVIRAGTLVPARPGASRFTAKYIALLPTAVEDQIANLGQESAMRHMRHDIGGEITALLEMLEAMTCSNVKVDVHRKEPVSINRRRTKKGKVPIWETKILTIEAPGNSRESERRCAGTHASPRQHLRRGHIRNLPDGRRVWVQSCVVGSNDRGVVLKSYNVKPSDSRPA